ncbi:kinase-like domain-containing protein [Aspergillus novoparasiticus]|uniref:non-specific serine/threonine protein kinase n=1 Tax=Aspergillus novoparasiticus TaxID=986946 RepID=A0A5N6EIX8_9EURO|nr:kinase-like domain-containing protein [Aspergillus novoparasiticus]
MSREATDIEEGTQVYRPGGFHPVYIGDVCKDRYKVLNKIGYGVYSTVWLARDLEPAQSGLENQFRALKVLSAESYEGTDSPIFEREILTHLRDGDCDQIGYDYVCHLFDDFEDRGPNGTHVCLVFELMGETLRSFGAWFAESRLPNSVMRRFTIQLLLVLDFAHEHNVIHTDIKPDNVFVKFRDHSLIEPGYLTDVAIPQQDRSEEQYSVVPSTPLRRYYFNKADSRRVDEFDIALGDWGVSSWANRHLSETIQPVALGSPENLGAVVLEIFQAVRMFSGSHLAEIVDLLVPLPHELLAKGDQNLVRDVFGNDGRIKDAPPMNRPGLADRFAAFLHAMMKMNPTVRVSAEDLYDTPS